MHHSYLDHLAYGKGPIHGVDPRAKLAATVLYAVAVAITPAGHGVRMAGLFLLLASVVAVSTVPVTYVLKRTALVLPFVGILGLFVPFTHPGTPRWEWQVATFTLSASRPGVLLAGTMVVKACLVAAGLLTLSATTRFDRLLFALRWYRVPRLFVLLLSFLYRYLFLVVDQAHHMTVARDARCPRKRPRKGWFSSTSMITSLSVRSFDRAERVHRAMLSRGHDGKIRILEPLQGGSVQWVGCTLFGAAAVALSLFPWPEFMSWTP